MTRIKGAARSAVSKRLAAGMERAPGTGRFVRKAPSDPAVVPVPDAEPPQADPTTPPERDRGKLWPSR